MQTQHRMVQAPHNQQPHRRQIIIHRQNEKMDGMMRIVIEKRIAHVAKRKNGDTSKVLSIKFQPANRIYSTTNWSGAKSIIR